MTGSPPFKHFSGRIVRGQAGKLCVRCGAAIPHGRGTGKGVKRYCSDECRNALDIDRRFAAVELWDDTEPFDTIEFARGYDDE